MEQSIFLSYARTYHRFCFAAEGKVERCGIIPDGVQRGGLQYFQQIDILI